MTVHQELRSAAINVYCELVFEQVRESRGLSEEEFAERLELTLQEYRRFHEVPEYDEFELLFAVIKTFAQATSLDDLTLMLSAKSLERGRSYRPSVGQTLGTMTEKQRHLP